MLRLDGVERHFGATRALAGLTLDVGEGELLALLGPSGSGKSTALRIVAGLDRPDAGRVLLDGRDVTDDAPGSRGVALVFQSFALFPHLSVEENIGFGLGARRVPRAERDERVREAAAQLDLDGLLGRRPSELSGGERQRVALARALAGRPRVLLMDEPLSNLDAPLRERAREEIRRLHRETGSTIVYVTHDQAEALALGDRVAVLEAGGLRQVADPDTLYERPADTFVAGFVGSPPMNLVAGELLDVHAEREVVAGFRAEDASCPAEDGAGFSAVVESVERTANRERLWRLTADGRVLVVRPTAGAVAQPGDRVRVSVPPAAVRVFDAKTGRAL